ncbi:MAG: hypothetical protein HUU20_26470 [Pirellulales bacterium]|nr:hypothetical protein [Pirellulales bacterium]
MAPGLDDVAAGRVTVAACLIWIAAPRLRAIGLLDEAAPAPAIEAERLLYGLLQKEPGDAYSRYNSLLRRLVRFEHALDRETQRALGEAGSERRNPVQQRPESPAG